MEYPLVSVITVNYRQAAMTCALLDALKKCDYPRLEVFVVDNGTREDIEDLLSTHYPHVKVIVSEQNLGFAGGNNLALARARGDYLFLVNNDAEPEPKAIANMVRAFQKVEHLGVVAPKIRYFDRPEIIQYAGFTPVHPITARNRTIGQGEVDEGQHDHSGPMPYAHGAAMMVSRAALDAAGPMPESYFLYYEELDWCRRIQEAGFGIWFEPSALVWHKESISTGAHSPLQTYYLNRNRILFMRRNAAWWSLPAFYLFFGLFTFPRWAITYAVKRQPEHLRALLLALHWHWRKSRRRADPIKI